PRATARSRRSDWSNAMADNYLQFSEMLTGLTDQEHDWLVEQLEYIYVVGEQEYQEADLPGDVDSVAITWQGRRVLRDRGHPDDDEYTDFELVFEKDEKESRSLWLYAEESGNPGQVAYLVQQ